MENCHLPSTTLRNVWCCCCRQMDMQEGHQDKGPPGQLDELPGTLPHFFAAILLLYGMNTGLSKLTHSLGIQFPSALIGNAQFALGSLEYTPWSACGWTWLVSLCYRCVNCITACQASSTYLSFTAACHKPQCSVGIVRVGCFHAGLTVAIDQQHLLLDKLTVEPDYLLKCARYVHHHHIFSCCGADFRPKGRKAGQVV